MTSPQARTERGQWPRRPEAHAWLPTRCARQEVLISYWSTRDASHLRASYCADPRRNHDGQRSRQQVSALGRAALRADLG
ncbi:hypothetical protein ACFPRL_23330 [Pseudoclavibacter helvolus]